jgi:hypothetical protein
MLLFVSDIAAWYKSSCSFTSIRRYSRTCAAQLQRHQAAQQRHQATCLVLPDEGVVLCGPLRRFLHADQDQLFVAKPTGLLLGFEALPQLLEEDGGLVGVNLSARTGGGALTSA